MSTSLGTATLDLRVITGTAISSVKTAVNQMVKELERANRATSIEVKFNATKALAEAQKARKDIADQFKTSLSLSITGLDQIVAQAKSIRNDFASTAADMKDAAEKLKQARQGNGGSGGGGGGGSPGSQGNPVITQLQRDMQVANSQFERGAISLKTYLRELSRIKQEGIQAGTGLQAGSRDAAQLERIMSGLSKSTARLNDKSLVNLRSDLAAARAEFERAIGAAGRFNFAGQRQATQAYEAELRNLDTRLRSLGDRSTVTASQLRSINQVTSQLASQRNAINGIFSQVGLAGNVQNALKSLPQFAAQMGGSLGAAFSGAQQLTGGLTALSGAAGPLGIALGVVVTGLAGFTAGAGKAIQVSGQFQQTMVDIKALTQPTADELNRLKQASMDIGTPLGVGARDAASAILELNKAGLSATDAIGGGLTGALTLAGAAGIDAAEGSRIAVGAMTAFGLSAQDLPGIADVFANFANKTFLGAQDLSMALAAVGPVAKDAGLDIQQFSGLMATLAQGGFKNMSDAGTSLKTMLLALQAPSTTAAGALDALKVSFFDAAGASRPLNDVLADLRQSLKGMTDQQQKEYLKDIFGTDGIRAALILLKQTPEAINENVRAMGLQGEASRVATERLESYQGQVKVLKANLEQLQIALGEALLPALTNGVKGMTSFLGEVKRGGPIIGEFKDALVVLGTVLVVIKANAIAAAGAQGLGLLYLAFGRLAAVVPTLTGGLTGLAGAQVALNTAIAASPAIIAAAGAAVVLYANHLLADIQRINDGITEMNSQAFSGLMGNVQQLREAGDAVSLARAKYLLAFQQMQDAQQGVFIGTNWMGEAQYRVDPKALELAKTRLAAAKAELEAARAQANSLTGQGPLLPGQVRSGAPSDFGLKIMQQSLQKTGVQTADSLVDFCAQWVRLTLGKAEPKISSYVNNLFQTDSNGDKNVTATDVARNAKNAGLYRQFMAGSEKDLKPGDTVFYTEGGQNHVGIYIGNGMVRGNNRVSAKNTGNPVGDVAMSSLGRVSGYMRADDLMGAATGFKGMQQGAKDTKAVLQQAIAEGERLIRQYGLALASGNKEWIAKAKTAVDTFKKNNKEAWNGVSADFKEVEKNARDGLNGTKKHVSEYGQLFDGLKGRLDVSQSLQNLGQNVVPQLEAIRRESLAGANAEKARNGETAKYRALLDLAGDAAKRLETIRNKKPDLTPLQQEQRTRAEQIKQEDIIQKMRAKSAQQLQDIIKGEVKKEGDLDRIKAAQDEIKRRRDQARRDAEEEKRDAKRLQEERNRIIQAGRENNLKLAEGAAQRIQQQRDAALKRAGDDAAKRLAIETQYAAGERKALETAAQIRFNIAEKAAKAGPAQLREGALKIARQKLADDLAAARSTDRVTEAQGRLNESVSRSREEYSQLATSMREKIAAGKVEDADLSDYLKKLDDLNAKVDKAGVGSQKFIQGARESAEALYQQAIDAQIASGAFDHLSDSYQGAARYNQKYVTSVEEIISNLPEARDQQEAYVQAIQELESSGAVAGGTVKALRDRIAELDAAEKQAQETTAATAAAWEKSTSEALDLADAYAQLGDTDAQLASLQGTLNDLYTAMDDGDDVATQIEKVTEAIERLLKVGEQNDEFNTFVASLGGTIDEQVSQVVERMAITADPKMKLRLKSLLDDLRSQLQTWNNDIYNKGLIPGANGFMPQPAGDGPSLETGGRALELTKALTGQFNDLIKATTEFEGELSGVVIDMTDTIDPQQLASNIREATELLNSEEGKKLSDTVRQGLQDGVENAQAYLSALAAITEEGVGDGASEALKNVGQRASNGAGNAFKDYLSSIFENASTLRENADFGNWLSGEFDKAREAGRLTDAELNILKQTMKDISAEPLVIMPPDRDGERLENMTQQLDQLVLNFQVGEISAADFAAQVEMAVPQLQRLAQAAAEQGKTDLAAYYRAAAAELQKLIPATETWAGRIQAASQIIGNSSLGTSKFGKGVKAGLNGLAAYLKAGGSKGGSQSIIAAADALIAGLGEAFKTGDEDIDKVIDTFVSGIQSTLAALAKGDKVGAIIAGVTTLVMTIVDIFQGGANSVKKATQQINDATKSIKIFDTSKYAKVVARDGFWGWLGFKKAEIDQESLDIAQTFGDAISSSISTGLIDGFRKGKVDARAITEDIKKQLTLGVVQGLIDGFMKSAGIQAMFQPFLDTYIEAFKTGNTSGMLTAINGLDNAMAGLPAMIEAFITPLQPILNRLVEPQDTNTDTTSPRDAVNAGATKPDIQTVQVSAPNLSASLNLDVIGTLSTAVQTYIPMFATSVRDFGATVGTLMAWADRLDRMLTRLESSPNGRWNA